MLFPRIRGKTGVREHCRFHANLLNEAIATGKSVHFLCTTSVDGRATPIAGVNQGRSGGR